MTIKFYKSIKKLQIQKYFQFIIKNKFKDLEIILHKKVKLFDGKIILSGRKSVIGFTRKIFLKKKIKINNIIILQDTKYKITLCKFDLNIGKKKLKVIDEFFFDKDNKILNITVYKR